MVKRIGDLSEHEVDRIIIKQADDDAAWGKPIGMRKPKPSSVSLPAELASRAAFFARLHREASVEQWLKRIIEERINIEEAVFAESKRDLIKR